MKLQILTEEMKSCEHDKVYSNFMYMSNPPQQDWICRKCKLYGRDTLGKATSNDFDRLMKEIEVKE